MAQSRLALKRGLESGYILKVKQLIDSKSGSHKSAFVKSFLEDSNSA